MLADLTEAFPNSGVYLVGGAVRDILLGKKITDIDLVVRHVTGEELENFLATRGQVVFAGKTFGVWKFHEIGKPKDEIYDIALPRTEFSLHKQGLYRDFEVKTNPRLPIEDDLARRDFTVNAMAYDLLAARLIDENNGQQDLKDKIIRTVGQAADRFQEDYSRLLRALRFALQLGFVIEKQTLNTVKTMIVNINDKIDDKRVLPLEIMAEEFLKSFQANPVGALDLWDEAGAIAETIPELLKMKGCPQPDNWHTEGDVWQHTRLALEKLSSAEFQKEFPGGDDLELIAATLFHDIGKPATVRTPAKDGTDRIRFDEHDVFGADLTKKILNRIKAAAPPDVNVKPERVAWAVRYHMLVVHGHPEKMRPTTIEKYFFNPDKASQTLLKLILVDGLATINQDGQALTNHYEMIKERMAEIKKKTGSHGFKLVKPLLSGDDIMKELGIKPGLKVGEILEKVRQKQLAGELTSKSAALEFVQGLE